MVVGVAGSIAVELVGNLLSAMILLLANPRQKIRQKQLYSIV
jgi:hypothetical protein